MIVTTSRPLLGIVLMTIICACGKPPKPNPPSRSEAIALGDRAAARESYKQALANYRYAAQQPGGEDVADKQRRTLALLVEEEIARARRQRAESLSHVAMQNMQALVAADCWDAPAASCAEARRVATAAAVDIWGQAQKLAAAGRLHQAVLVGLQAMRLPNAPFSADFAALRARARAHHEMARSASMDPVIVAFHDNVLADLGFGDKKNITSTEKPLRVRLSGGSGRCARVIAHLVGAASAEWWTPAGSGEADVTLEVDLSDCLIETTTATEREPIYEWVKVQDGTRTEQDIEIFEEDAGSMPVQNTKCSSYNAHGRCTGTTTSAGSYSSKRISARVVDKEVPVYKSKRRRIGSRKVEVTRHRQNIVGRAVVTGAGEPLTVELETRFERKFGKGEASAWEVRMEAEREAAGKLRSALSAQRSDRVLDHLVKARKAVDSDAATATKHYWIVLQRDHENDEASDWLGANHGVYTDALVNPATSWQRAQSSSPTALGLFLPEREATKAERRYSDYERSRRRGESDKLELPMLPSYAVYYRLGLSPIADIERASSVAAWYAWGSTDDDGGIVNQIFAEYGNDDLGGDSERGTAIYRRGKVKRSGGLLYGIVYQNEREVLSPEEAQGLSEEQQAALRQGYESLGPLVRYERLFRRFAVDAEARLSLLDGGDDSSADQSLSSLHLGASTTLLRSIYLRAESSFWFRADDPFVISVNLGIRRPRGSRDH